MSTFGARNSAKVATRSLTRQAGTGKIYRYAADGAVRWGRAVLGCLLEVPELWRDAVSLEADDFVLSSHQKIFGAIAFLHENEKAADLVSLRDELGDSVSPGEVGALIDDAMPEAFTSYVRKLRECTELRRFSEIQERLNSATTHGECLSLVMEMQQVLQTNIADQGSIRSYAAIPDVATMPLDSIEPIIPGLLERGNVNLLSGDPGIGKSYLALAVAVSCAMGSDFLGRRCRDTKVLMLDRENPLALIQKRLDLISGGPVPNLRIWGGWLTDPPALIGDPRLLQMAEAEGPLLFVFDSLVRFHEADENSATEMRSVMQAVRRLADLGSTVLLLHHRPKSHETKYRGSSDILAGVDVAISVERTDAGLRLVAYKSRDAQLIDIAIQSDFANGKFLAADTEAVVEHRDHVEMLRAIIEKHPGLSQNAIIRQSGLRRADVVGLLRGQDDRLWTTKPGPRKSTQYWPLAGDLTGSRDRFLTHDAGLLPELVPEIPATSSGADSHRTESVKADPVVPRFSTLMGGKRELVAPWETTNEDGVSS